MMFGFINQPGGGGGSGLSVAEFAGIRAPFGSHSIVLTSATGGTGALTCSAQSGSPLPSHIWGGTRLLDYEIIEWADETKAEYLAYETGICSYNTSTNVLTRTKVCSTWLASGPTFRPSEGSATAPTALSFGATSANIDIMVGPMAASSIPSLPFVYGAVASVSDGLGTFADNLTTGGTVAMSTGVVEYTPYLLFNPILASQMSIRTTTTLTGGTPTFDASIYEVDSNGTPGKRLVQFTRLTGIGTTNTTYTSTALATPIFLLPGWYWLGSLYVANSATGTFTPRAAGLKICGPQGSLFSAGSFFAQAKTLSGQTALNDPATAATGHSSNFTSIALAIK